MLIRTLDRYLVRKVASTVIFALIGLILFSLIIRITDQLSLVGQGTYSVVKAIIYSSIFAIPDINTFFPAAGLLGAVIALGILASHRELIIIQAAGVSKFRILIGLLWFIIPAGLINLAIQQWVSPPLTNYALNLKASALTGRQDLFSQNQTVWAKSNHQFVYIDISQADKLNNIFIINFSPVNSVNSQGSNPKQALQSIIQGQDASWNPTTKQWEIKQALVYSYGGIDNTRSSLNSSLNSSSSINTNPSNNSSSSTNTTNTANTTNTNSSAVSVPNTNNIDVLAKTLVNIDKLGLHTDQINPLILQAVTQSQSHRFTLKLYQDYQWQSSLTPNKLSLVNQQTDNLSITTLWNYIKFLNNTEQNSSQYSFIFWNKIFSIVSFFVMIFIATATIFGNMRNSSMLLKVFYAVVVGLLFHLLNNIVGPTLVGMGIPPVLAALSASFIFSLYGTYLYLKRN